jgi:exosome complex RNA-binding protein Rrp42 (RNase PH superfamily)
MVFVLHHLGNILQRLMLGTYTVLNNSEKKTMHIAEVAVQKEEGHQDRPQRNGGC